VSEFGKREDKKRHLRFTQYASIIFDFLKNESIFFSFCLYKSYMDPITSSKFLNNFQVFFFLYVLQGKTKLFKKKV
jgi:outer membrane receptor for ferric coprogen and ferric-rhodotorulic acid